jgi:ferredoxin
MQSAGARFRRVSRIAEGFLSSTIKEIIMAYKIIPDLCNGCAACESECPNRAISHIEKLFKIDASKCQECAGVYDSPMCAQLCNTDACVPA